MKIIDISMSLAPDSIIYPGDTPFSTERIKDLDSGELCNLSRLEMSSHSGTHLDAPSHFIREGKTIDEMPLDIYYGPVRIIDFGAKEKISALDLKPHLGAGLKRIICKTRGWELIKKGDFNQNHPVFTADAAEFLVQNQIQLVGLDFITVERGEGENYPVHTTLLSNGIAILEGLYLEDVKPGDYILAAFPLKIAKGDGSPCRAVLIDQG